MKLKVGWLIDVLCALVAYVLARWIHQTNEGVFANLHWELLTFALIFVMLEALIRGRKLAQRGK